MSNLNNDLIVDEIKNFENSPIDNQIQTIQEMKNALQESMDKRNEMEDPDNIIYRNIDRANKFLDILEDKINNREKGQKDGIARLFEVSAQLINAITTATGNIIGGQKDDMEYQYKLQLLELKNKELTIKQAINTGGKGGNTTNQQIIVSDRESILDLIYNQKKIEENTEKDVE